MRQRARSAVVLLGITGMWLGVAGMSFGGIVLLLQGGCSFTTAHFAEIHMARAVDEGGRPTIKTDVFNKHDAVLYCCVRTANTPGETVTKAVWTYRGAKGPVPIDSAEVTVNDDRWVTFSLRATDVGLPYGAYAVDLSIDNKHQSSISFTIGPMFASSPVKEAVLASAINSSYFPTEETDVFPVDARTIHAPVYVEDAPPATVVTATWFRDEPSAGSSVVATTDFTVNGGSGWIGFSLTPSAPLPTGVYHAQILVNGAPVTHLPFKVQ